MSNNPLVSVVIPTYNNAKYLREALMSIIKQSYHNLEIIVVDDGSTDGTTAILQSLAKRDARLSIITHKHNQGIVRSLNQGFTRAHGKYIARMDADDISLPERIATQVAYLEGHPAVGVCGAWISVFGTQKYVWQTPIDSAAIKLRLFTECALAHPTVMLRRDLIAKSHQVYDPTYQYVEDYKLWVELSQQTEFHNLPQVLLEYRTHKAQIGAERANEQRAAADKLKIFLLEQLLPEATKSQKLLHVRAMSWPVATSWAELDVLRDWYHTLLQANGARGIYTYAAFSRLLAERWTGVCYLAKSLGWRRYLYVLTSRPLRLDAVIIVFKIKLSSLQQYIWATLKRFL